MHPHASPCVPMRPHASRHVGFFLDPVSLCVSRLAGVGAKVSQPAECDQRTRDASLRSEAWAMAWMRVLVCSVVEFTPFHHVRGVLQITVSCVNFKVRSRWILWVYRTVVVEVWYHSVRMTSHDNGVCDISGRCLFDHDQCAVCTSPEPYRQRWMPCSWRDEMGIGTCCFNVVLPWHLQIFHFDKPPVS